MSEGETNVDGTAPRLLGGVSAVMQAAAFGVIGLVALENVAYGAIVGLFAGLGSFLFFPWFLRLSAVQNESAEDLGLSETVRRAGGNARVSLVGFGLELGAMAMLVLGFAREDPHVGYGIAVAVSVTLVVSLLGSELVTRKLDASGA